MFYFLDEDGILYYSFINTFLFNFRFRSDPLVVYQKRMHVSKVLACH